jgi:monoterpene epsilon-lactone hydrolase
VVSMRARWVMAKLRATRAKRFYDDASTLHRHLRRHQRPSQARPPRGIRRRYDVERRDVDGFPCYTLRSPRRTDSSLHVVHLHGGGFVEEIEPQHWRYGALLADHLGCAVTLPIYPLVPHYDHTAILPMVEAAYDRLSAERLVITGDSAGAALALAIAQKLREQGRPQPERLILFSPWLDVLLEDPISVLLDEHDPMLGIAGLREAGRMYAEGADPRDPRISPLHADLTGLGPFSVFIGTRDLLLPDARRFAAKAADAGIDVDFCEYPGMFHDWMLQPIPEGREAMNHVERILRRSPGKGTPARE